MPKPIQVLLVEDSPLDAELILRELRRAGLQPEGRRVETEADFLAALHPGLDVILSDFALPEFNGLRALELLEKSGLDIPFIIISGTIGEELAVTAMKNCAADYLLKDRLARLGPAVSQAGEQSRLRKERLQADAALRRSEAYIQQIIENSPVAQAVTSGHRKRIDLVNRRFTELFGYTLADMPLVDDWWRLAFPEADAREQVRAEWAARVEKAAAVGGTMEPLEVRVTCKDGSCRVIEACVTVIDDRQLVAFIDLTDRKRSEAAVQERLQLEERLSRLTATVPGAIYSYRLRPDGSSCFAYASPQLADILGIAFDAVKDDASPAFQLVHEDDIDRLHESIAEAARATSSWTHVFRVRHPSRGLIWIEGRSVPQPESDGSILWHGFLLDVTERKEAEKRLGERERELANVLTNTPDLVARYDRQLRCVYANEILQSVTGVAPAAWIGRTNVELGLPEEMAGRWDAALREVFATGKPKTIEFSHPTQQGMMDVLCRIVPEFGEDSTVTHVLSVSRDITERNRAAEQIQRNEERLRLAMQVASMATWEWDLTSNHVAADPQIGQLFGGSTVGSLKEELDYRVFIHPDDRSGVEAAMLMAIQGVEDYHKQFRVTWRDGSIHWLEGLGRVLRGADGRPLRMVGVTMDITGRKLSGQRVAEALKYTRTLLEASPMGILTFAPDGSNVSANEAAAAIVGTTVEQLRKQNFRELESWRRAGLTDAAERALTTGKAQQLEVEMTTSFGRKVAMSCRFAAFPYEGENHLLALFADVTERMRSEARSRAFSDLAHRLSGVQSAQEAGEIIVAVADELIGWDSCALALYSRAEDRIHRILNKDIIDGVRTNCPGPYNNTLPTPRQRQVIEQGAILILKEPPFTMSSETLPFGDTSRPSASIMLAPVRDGANVTGILSVQSYREKAFAPRDLETLQSLADHCGGALERLRAEEALHASEERFRQLAENIREVFWLVEAEGGALLYVSPNYEEIWGRTCASLYANPTTWLEGIHPQERPRVLDLVNTRQNISGYDTEYRVVRPDGSVRWVHDRAFPIRDPQGKVYRVAGIAEDITARKQIEEHYRQSQKMEAIGQLAGGVAHDFNNLLSVIGCNAALLIDTENQNEPAEAAEFAREIVKAADRAAGLTRQLLLFSRKQVMQEVPLNLNDVVSNTTKMLQRILGEDISLQAEFASNLSAVSADAGMIEQILLNFAVNSRDAMPNGGRLTITTGVETVTAEQVEKQPDAMPGRHVCLSVQDTGCGIPAELLPRIFEPFFTTKDVGKGTGLGLATVYGIIKQHRGWVTVASEVGQGTTFRIFLPAITEAAGKAREAARKSQLPRGHETILLVEDEPALRGLANRLLVRCGYTVMEAHDGAEAMAVWEKQGGNFDLLLTDLVMPGGMSGRDLALKLKSTRPQLKVIYTSGYSADFVGKGLSLQEGVNFLAKPYPPQQLAQTVRDCLDR